MYVLSFSALSIQRSSTMLLYWPCHKSIGIVPESVLITAALDEMLRHASTLVSWGARSQAIHQVELLLHQSGKGFGAVGLDPVPINGVGGLAGREVSPDLQVNPIAWQHRCDDLAKGPLPGNCQEMSSVCLCRGGTLVDQQLVGLQAQSL